MAGVSSSVQPFRRHAGHRGGEPCDLLDFHEREAFRSRRNVGRQGAAAHSRIHRVRVPRGAERVPNGHDRRTRVRLVRERSAVEHDRLRSRPGGQFARLRYGDRCVFHSSCRFKRWPSVNFDGQTWHRYCEFHLSLLLLQPTGACLTALRARTGACFSDALRTAPVALLQAPCTLATQLCTRLG